MASKLSATGLYAAAGILQGSSLGSIGCVTKQPRFFLLHKLSVSSYLMSHLGAFVKKKYLYGSTRTEIFPGRGPGARSENP